MKKTSQLVKNTGKQESNALKRPVHRMKHLVPQSNDPRRKAHGDLRKKSLFVTFLPLEAHDFRPS